MAGDAGLEHLRLLRRHGCYEGSGRPTHTLMGGGGGSLYIPDSLLDALYDALDHDLRSGQKAYLVEQVSDVFCFFCDLDLPELLPSDVVRRVSGLTRRAVQAYFPSLPDLRCAICAPLASPEAVERTTPRLHLVFPDVYVTAREARVLCAGLELALRASGVDVDWRAALDLGVYSTGLRMLGCHKGKKCEKRNCPRVVGNPCACRGLKWYDGSPHVYWLWDLLPEGDLLYYKPSRSRAIRLCSIRCPQGTRPSGLVMPPRAPAYDEESGVPPQPGGLKRPRGGETTWRPINLPPQLQTELLRCVRGFHGPLYRDVTIQTVLAGAGDPATIYLVKIGGEGNRYCLNKRGEHCQSTVYFVLTPLGLTQRCYSKKTDPRVSGLPCPTYRSEPKPVPAQLLAFLWPMGQRERPPPLPPGHTVLTLQHFAAQEQLPGRLWLPEGPAPPAPRPLDELAHRASHRAAQASFRLG